MKKKIASSLVATSVAWTSLAVAPTAAAPVVPAQAGEPSCNGRPATIVGTSSRDVLWGTPDADVIVALGGNDLVFARGGDDVVCGGDGNDRIYGDAGADTLDGGDGRDVLVGGRDADELHGGPGHDTLRGGSGDDTGDGGPGNDYMTGGAGADVLNGDDGIDRIYGARGDDTITGGSGNDRLFGDAGDDLLDGGDGNDRMYGGLGADAIDGSTGVDRANGGAQSDTCDDAEQTVRCEVVTFDGDPDDADLDGDGIPDSEDPDIDGDGIPNDQDPTPTTPEPGLPPLPDDIDVAETLPLDPITDETSILVAVDTGSPDTQLIVRGHNIFTFDFIAQPVDVGAAVQPFVVSEVFDFVQDARSPDFAAATLRMAYDPALLPSGDTSQLRVWTFDVAADRWTIVPGEQYVDVERTSVYATLDHFSCYAVLNAAVDADILGELARCDVPDVQFSTNLLSIPNSGLPSSVLFQPAAAGADPVVTERLVVGRNADGPQLGTVTFTDTVSFSPTGDLDTTTCGAACTLFQAEFSTATAQREAIALAVESQSVFTQDFAGTLDGDAVRDRLVDECLDGLRSDRARVNAMVRQDCVRFVDSVQKERKPYLEWDSFGLGPADIDPDNGAESELRFADDFTPATLDLFVDVLMADDMAVFASGGAMRMFGVDRPGTRIPLFPDNAGTTTYSAAALEDSLAFRSFVKALIENDAFITDRLGDYYDIGQLLDLQAPMPAAIADGQAWLADNTQLFFDQDPAYQWARAHDRPGPSRFEVHANPAAIVQDNYLLTMATRMHAFDGDPAFAAELLLSFGSVTDTSLRGASQNGIDLRRFTGFERQLASLFEDAIATVSPSDRTTQHEMVFRLPETYAGIRNQLITGVYTEYADAISAWADGTESPTNQLPVTWGHIASYASAGIGGPIRGDFNALADAANDLGLGSEHVLRQASADGNQWIFGDALRHYATLLELIEANPNPSVAQWEAYLNNPSNFRARDRRAQEAMIALIGSRYADDDLAERQRLMFLATAAFGDVEQAGAQWFLRQIEDDVFGPNEVAVVFFDAQMGARELNVDQPIPEIYNFDAGAPSTLNNSPQYVPDGARAANFQSDFWTTDFVCWSSDPAAGPCNDPAVPGVDRNAIYDSTVDFQFDGGDRLTTIDVNLRTGFDPSVDFVSWREPASYSPRVSTWRTGGSQPLNIALCTDLVPCSYIDSDAELWADFPDRMWFLVNLFRATIVDPNLRQEPRDFNGLAHGFGNRKVLTGDDADWDLDRHWNAAAIAQLSVETFDNGGPQVVPPDPGDPSLAIAASTSEIAPVPGLGYPLDLTISNDGPGPADDVIVTFSWPDELAPPSSVGLDARCANSGAETTCEIGNLDADGVTDLLLEPFATTALLTGGATVEVQITEFRGNDVTQTLAFDSVFENDDVDGDTIANRIDNCVLVSNATFFAGGLAIPGPDSDSDGTGDACDLRQARWFDGQETRLTGAVSVGDVVIGTTIDSSFVVIEYGSDGQPAIQRFGSTPLILVEPGDQYAVGAAGTEIHILDLISGGVTVLDAGGEVHAVDADGTYVAVATDTGITTIARSGSGWAITDIDAVGAIGDDIDIAIVGDRAVFAHTSPTPPPLGNNPNISSRRLGSVDLDGVEPTMLAIGDLESPVLAVESAGGSVFVLSRDEAPAEVVDARAQTQAFVVPAIEGSPIEIAAATSMIGVDGVPRLVVLDESGGLSWTAAAAGAPGFVQFRALGSVGVGPVAPGGVSVSGSLDRVVVALPSSDAEILGRVLVPETGYEAGDLDADGILNGLDNCPAIANPDQTDTNDDGRGDVCVASRQLDVRTIINPDPLVPGAPAAVTYIATNTLGAAVVDATLDIELASVFRNVEAPPNCLRTASSPHRFQCEIGTIEVDASFELTVFFDVPADYDPSSPIGTIVLRPGDGDPTIIVVRPPMAPPVPSDPCTGDDESCVSGQSVGDPHLVTFDGVAYDMQAIGEFVLAQSNDGRIVVQTRTSGIWPVASVNSRVAALVGSTRVEVDVVEGLIIDGEPADLVDGFLDLGDGAFVAQSGSGYRIAWPGTDDRPVLSVGRGFRALNVGFAIPASMTGQFAGLLGDGDGDRSNDFVTRAGVEIAQPLTFDDLYARFAGSWRIDDTQSLFTYPDGLGTADFTDLTRPTGLVSLADFDPAVVAAARLQCERAGVTHTTVRDSCALDLIITQDASFLSAFLGVVLPSGYGPMETVRDVSGAPIIVDGIADLTAASTGDLLYASVTAENKIVAIDPIEGTVADVAVIDEPTYLTTGPDGDLYVTSPGEILGRNIGTGTITRIDLETGAQTIVASELRSPAGIAVASDGTVYSLQRGYDYFGSPWNARVTQVDGTSHTILFGWLNTSANDTDLTIDSDDRLWVRGRQLLRSWKDGVQTTYGNVAQGGRYVVDDGTIYYAFAGGPFSGCDQRNTSQVFGLPVGADGTVGVAQRVAGNRTGFSDSTFNDPFGRMCGGGHAMTVAGDRLYMRDSGNDAIRYVSLGR